MQFTTLCYIEKDGKYLMLHRVKKNQDVNAGKWIGVGGHFERDESPDECLIREVREETGLELTHYTFRGIITFVNSICETEYMCLYTADGFTGKVIDCDEGELQWVEKSKVMNLNLWEGDKVFLKRLLDGSGFFTLKLVYNGDKLIECK
ncbi:MAG: 8-oxo-dGTP diphosphatase [Fibrobacteraceae bacterium]|nr:8-oxo-dGTP diphosphatase [Fibrobacteraceae bacterium]